MNIYFMKPRKVRSTRTSSRFIELMSLDPIGNSIPGFRTKKFPGQKWVNITICELDHEAKNSSISYSGQLRQNTINVSQVIKLLPFI